MMVGKIKVPKLFHYYYDILNFLYAKNAWTIISLRISRSDFPLHVLTAQVITFHFQGVGNWTIIEFNMYPSTNGVGT